MVTADKLGAVLPCFNWSGRPLLGLIHPGFCPAGRWPDQRQLGKWQRSVGRQGQGVPDVHVRPRDCSRRRCRSLGLSADWFGPALSKTRLVLV